LGVMFLLADGLFRHILGADIGREAGERLPLAGSVR